MELLSDISSWPEDVLWAAFFIENIHQFLGHKRRQKNLGNSCSCEVESSTELLMIKNMKETKTDFQSYKCYQDMRNREAGERNRVRPASLDVLWNCVWLFVWVALYAPCAFRSLKRHEEGTGSLYLELQVLVNYFVGSGIST